MLARLKLYLLGSFYATLDGELLTEFRSDKARALLAYLPLEASEPIRRNVLKTLLWDGYDSKSASLSLRVVLSNLTKLLKPLDLLTVTRQTVQFNVSSDDFWCDIIEFLNLYQTKPLTRPLLQEIKSLYRDEFLNGLVIDDSEPFENWKRQRLTLLADHLVELFPHNLPRQMTIFIGRQTELKAVAARVLDINYPLVTILGEGGIGKTRLALAVARQLRGHFLDGVYFISLATLDAPTAKQKLEPLLATTIAEALGLTFRGEQSPKEQLLNYLQSKECLLLIDNFEQFLPAGGADFVWDLLQAAQQAQVLITSRESLNFQAEYIFRLEGLPVPKEPDQRAESYSSIQLFVERANRYQRFTLDMSNLAAVIELCQVVEGLPLALELAASLMLTQELAQIALSIKLDLDVLTTTRRDHPPRHRSIRATFEYSWRLLSSREQKILALCSVFRGGFIEEAALAVALATKEEFTTLVHKSLLQYTKKEEGVTRYDMHELVCQFAAEKLNTLALDEQIKQHLAGVYERHSRYYLNFLANCERKLLKAEPKVLRQIQLELPNIRLAWQSALKSQQVIRLEPSLVMLSFFYQTMGLIQEGETVMSDALNLLPKQSPIRPQLLIEQATFQEGLAKYEFAELALQEALDLTTAQMIRAQAYLRWGIILWRQSKLQEAHERLQRACLLYEKMPQTIKIKLYLSESLNYMGVVTQFQGRVTTAFAYFKQALTLKQAIDDKRGESNILKNLAINSGFQGDYMQALVYLESALHIWQMIGNQRDESTGLSNLGFAYYILGDNAKAKTYTSEALSKSRFTGDKRTECNSLSNLALLMNRGHEQQKALYHAQQALQLSIKIGYSYLESESLINLGHIYLSLGDYSQASKNYQQAFLLRKEMQRLTIAMEAKAGLARVALLRGLLEEAKVHIAEILTHLEHNPTLLGINEPMPVFLTCYHVLSASQAPHAEEFLEKAHELLQERAAKITDERLLQSYLQNVPAHREIVRLWQSHLEEIGEGG